MIRDGVPQLVRTVPLRAGTAVRVLLAGLLTDLFSHHASSLEVYVFVAVDERGEDDIKLCRRCNGK